MATALNCWAWSTTAADNATADSSINWAEGQAAGTVNDSARAMMAALKKLTNVLSGNVTVGGTANAITITTGQSISSGHQALGFSVRFKAANTNTGATTVNVDTLGAVALKGSDGADLTAGQIVSGGIYDIAHDGTNYKLLGASAPATRASLGLATSDSPQFAGINLGHASDTTLTRVSTGRIAVEGVTIEEGANRASFSAHKNGTNQTMSATGPTKVTFGTEVFDVGSHYASSRWTPPAGTCRVTAQVATEGIDAADLLMVTIYKNGSPFREFAGKPGSVATVVVAGAHLSIVDQCNGTDYYEVYAATVLDSSWTIRANSSLTGNLVTFFSGEMV